MVIDSSKIKALLAEKKMSITVLAKELEVDRSKLSAWLFRGKIPDSQIDSYEKICDLLDYNNQASGTISGSSKTIPYYDLDVTAGEVSFQDNLLQEPASEYYSIPGLKADFIVPVFGDSMVDAVNPGDKIAVRRVNDLTVIPFGKKFLVITEEHRMVKYVKRHEDPKFVTLVSHNPHYDPIDIPKRKIVALFKVMEVLKREEI